MLHLLGIQYSWPHVGTMLTIILINVMDIQTKDTQTAHEQVVAHEQMSERTVPCAHEQKWRASGGWRNSLERLMSGSLRKAKKSSIKIHKNMDK